jgi:hypothetical protein
MTARHPLLDAPGLAAHNDRSLPLAKGRFNWQVTARPGHHTPYIIQAQMTPFITEDRTLPTARVAFTQQRNASYAPCLKDGQQYISKVNTSRPVPFLRGQHRVGPIPTLKEDTHGSSTSHY